MKRDDTTPRGEYKIPVDQDPLRADVQAVGNERLVYLWQMATRAAEICRKSEPSRSIQFYLRSIEIEAEIERRGMDMKEYVLTIRTGRQYFAPAI